MLLFIILLVFIICMLVFNVCILFNKILYYVGNGCIHYVKITFLVILITSLVMQNWLKSLFSDHKIYLG